MVVEVLLIGAFDSAIPRYPIGAHAPRAMRLFHFKEMRMSDLDPPKNHRTHERLRRSPTLGSKLRRTLDAHVTELASFLIQLCMFAVMTAAVAIIDRHTAGYVATTWNGAFSLIVLNVLSAFLTVCSALWVIAKAVFPLVRYCVCKFASLKRQLRGDKQ